MGCYGSSNPISKEIECQGECCCYQTIDGIQQKTDDLQTMLDNVGKWILKKNAGRLIIAIVP